jgi:hypothetical protein
MSADLDRDSSSSSSFRVRPAMMLPLTSRRSTTTWAVNAATFAVLLSSVWWSAQQRPAQLSRFGATPPAAEATKRPLSTAGATTASRAPISGAANDTLAGAALDSEALHRVAYAPAITR